MSDSNSNSTGPSQKKRTVRTPEQRRVFLEGQLRAFDAREDARLRASVKRLCVEIEQLQARANKAMKGRLHDACGQALQILSSHTNLPST
jgi:hypothetical protein